MMSHTHLVGNRVGVRVVGLFKLRIEGLSEGRDCVV